MHPDGGQARRRTLDPLEAPIGPMTRAKAKRLKEALNGLIKVVQAEAEVKHVQRTQEEPRIINVLEVQSVREEAVEGWHQSC